MWSRRKFISTVPAAIGSSLLFEWPAAVFAQQAMGMEGDWLSRFETADGRIIEYFQSGPDSALPLVCHHGTPFSALGYASWTDAAAAAGMRVIAYSRPGYGVSDRLPGRNVAQAASDTAALLDYLDADTFVTAGWSGGGPHALACAALLTGRCKGVATLGGVGAWGQSDLDFLADMGPENIDEFGAALTGEEALADYLEKNYADYYQVTGDQVAAALGGLVSQPDKDVLTSTFAEGFAAASRWALHSGFGGWIDDDLAFTRDWGFGLDAIRVPVTVWQGQQDKMVPTAHGNWLARHIPGARAEFDPGQGHLSLVTAHLETILRDLAASGG